MRLKDGSQDDNVGNYFPDNFRDEDTKLPQFMKENPEAEKGGFL